MSSVVEPPEPRARGGGRRRTVGDMNDISGPLSALSEKAGEGLPTNGDARIERSIASLGALLESVFFVGFEDVSVTTIGISDSISSLRRGGRGEGRVGFGEECGDGSEEARGEEIVGVKIVLCARRSVVGEEAVG